MKDELVETSATPAMIARYSSRAQRILIKQIEELSGQFDELDRRFKKLEHDQPLRTYQNRLLEKQRRKRVVNLCGGFKAPAYLQRDLSSRVFREIMVEYRQKFGVAAYQETRANQYDKAMQFYQHWQPDFELSQLIEQANEESGEEHGDSSSKH
jgi:TolA-binding protein